MRIFTAPLVREINPYSPGQNSAVPVPGVFVHML